MKTIHTLALVSLVSTIALITSLAVNAATLPLFATASSALLLLLWVGDYRPRRDSAAGTTAALRRQPLPLAA